MFNWLLTLFQSLFEAWGKLPKGTQEKIIEVIVKTFEPILRAFYKKYTNQKSKDENND